MLPDRLLEILVCPRCRGDLRLDDRKVHLVCRTCGRTFAIEENIPIMIESDERPPA